MPHKPKAKIIPFPSKISADKQEQSPLAELVSILAGSGEEVPLDKPKPASTKARAPRANASKPEPPITVSGSGNQIATAGGTINNFHGITPPAPIVIVQTGVGVIDAAQKRQITDWVNAVVEASKVRKPPKNHASVWNAFKKYMKVSKYDEISAADFEKAKKWLQRAAAIPKSMASAPKKVEGWRNNRYSAIHARCKERDFGDWRIAFMTAKYGTVTMKDLSDDDLEALYQTVMNKK